MSKGRPSAQNAAIPIAGWRSADNRTKSSGRSEKHARFLRVLDPFRLVNRPAASRLSATAFLRGSSNGNKSCLYGAAIGSQGRGGRHE
jgi:hypothetical protein